MPEYIHRGRVEFRDTDAAGIAHFSTFPVWMEQAEHAALRHVGLSVMDPGGSDGVSWPRVSVHCDFQSPLRFEDTFEVHVTLSRFGTKSITYGFRFVRDQQPIASGQITVVCCQRDDRGQWQSTPIPADVLRQLQLLTP